MYPNCLLIPLLPVLRLQKAAGTHGATRLILLGAIAAASCSSGTMYGIWHDWDGEPVEEAPLFYQNCNENTGRILQGLDDDIQRTKAALEKAMGVDLSALLPVVPYLKEAYGHEIEDDSTISQVRVGTNVLAPSAIPPATSII